VQTIAIIGVGRMGGLIADKISPFYDLILIDKDARRCGLLAKQLEATATTEYSLLSQADCIILALPAAIIPEAIKEISPFLQREQLLINISTDTEMSVFKPVKGLCKLASAKIIGHALQMAGGELPMIIVDAEDEHDRRRTAEIFGKIGTVGFGKEKVVMEINHIASEEGIKAAYNIKKRLKELNIPDEYLSFAIRNVACGTMNAFALGDAGPFAQKIIKQISEKDLT